MNTACKIAWRYLWSKKSHNAIHIVSGVSVIAVMVVTAAMVCILSVMNGFGIVVEGMFSKLDPDLRITAVQGTSFTVTQPSFRAIQEMPEVAVFSKVVEQTALLEYENQQVPVQVRGIEENYQQLTDIDSIMVDGRFILKNDYGPTAILGIGLCNQLNINSHFTQPIQLYAPKRGARVNLLRPDDSFTRRTCHLAGIYAVNQTKYDDHLLLTDLPLTRDLFGYDEHTVTAIELKINGDIRSAKNKIKALLGDAYSVCDQYEQQADFFHVLRIEKWLTALLMIFILLIASFNTIGSLTMLIIDKRDDIRTLHNLGANTTLIRKIFLFEGWLISLLGAILGILLGVTLCLLQEHFGFIKLGDGSQYVLSTYPVHTTIPDLLIIVAIVLGIGFLAAWYPTRHMTISPPTDE